MTIHFVLLVSRQGKCRLAKYYSPFSDKEKQRAVREVSNLALSRAPKLCNFVEWKNYKIVYRRYASLYFIVAIDNDDNELITLEVIHAFVEILDAYFGNVCELDLIFHFHKAYYILDEFLMAGELQETSKQLVLRTLREQDSLQETEAGKLGAEKVW
jgi:AP-1 complex subunit sigma 1/2